MASEIAAEEEAAAVDPPAEPAGQVACEERRQTLQADVTAMSEECDSLRRQRDVAVSTLADREAQESRLRVALAGCQARVEASGGGAPAPAAAFALALGVRRRLQDCETQVSELSSNLVSLTAQREALLAEKDREVNRLGTADLEEITLRADLAACEAATGPEPTPAPPPPPPPAPAPTPADEAPPVPAPPPPAEPAEPPPAPAPTPAAPESTVTPAPAETTVTPGPAAHVTEAPAPAPTAGPTAAPEGVVPEMTTTTLHFVTDAPASHDDPNDPKHDEDDAPMNSTDASAIEGTTTPSGDGEDDQQLGMTLVALFVIMIMMLGGTALFVWGSRGGEDEPESTKKDAQGVELGAIPGEYKPPGRV